MLYWQNFGCFVLATIAYNLTVTPATYAWNHFFKERFLLALSAASLALGFFSAYSQYWALTLYFVSMSVYLYFQSKQVSKQVSELEQAQRFYHQAQEALRQSEKEQAGFVEAKPQIEAVVHLAEVSCAATRQAVNALAEELQSPDIQAILAELRAENERTHWLIGQQQKNLKKLSAYRQRQRERHDEAARKRETNHQLRDEMRREVKELAARAARAKAQLGTNA